MQRAWRDEAEANSGLTEAQLAEIKRKRQTKVNLTVPRRRSQLLIRSSLQPLAAATGYAPNYTPRPKYLPGLRSTSTTLDPIVEEPEASHGSTAPTRSSSAACRLPESRKEDSYTSGATCAVETTSVTVPDSLIPLASDHASSTASARQATTTGADQKLQSPAAATDNSAEPRRPLQETFKVSSVLATGGRLGLNNIVTSYTHASAVARAHHLLSQPVTSEVRRCISNSASSRRRRRRRRAEASCLDGLRQRPVTAASRARGVSVSPYQSFLAPLAAGSISAWAGLESVPAQAASVLDRLAGRCQAISGVGICLAWPEGRDGEEEVAAAIRERADEGKRPGEGQGWLVGEAGRRGRGVPLR